MAEEAKEALLSGIMDTYRDKKYADVELVGIDKTWLAHKIVICSQSELFRKDCDGEFQEGKLSKIDLSDEDPQTVEAMLSFLYTRDYSDQANGQNDVAPLVLDARVFVIADKRFIPTLKKAAVTKFASHAETAWSTPAFAAAIAELYRDGVIPDRALLEVILQQVKKHANALLNNPEDQLAFHAALKGYPEFCYEVSKLLGSSEYKPKDERTETRYSCPSCGTIFSVSLLNRQDYGFDCPLGCYGKQSRSWWTGYQKSL